MEKVAATNVTNFSLELITTIFDSVSEGIMITDARSNIINVNPAFEIVTGYRKEEVLGCKPDVIQSGLHKKEFYLTMWEDIRNKGSWSGEIWNRRKTGDIYPEWLTIAEIRDASGEITNYCGVFEDLTYRKTAEDEIERQASVDSITGLANRFTFNKRMEVLLQSTKKNQQHAILFLDLDRFKQVNDMLGHAIGDEILKEIAYRLRTVLRNKDIVARYGGDEFVITLTNIHHPREAIQLAEEILSLLEVPFDVESQHIHISTSIGISVYPTDGKETEMLINKADKAMYFAKEHGRNQFVFYFDGLNIDAKRLLVLDNELRKAIRKNEFQLHYQPKVNSELNQIEGLEALVRWTNDELGFVSPDEFIPYAEESGLIIPISECIIQRACEDLNFMRNAGVQNTPIAINISSIHFHQKDFVDSINAILTRNNCSPKDFEIELTERTVMSNESATIQKLILLKKMGFKLSIDDFGTGYSSLSYLVQFPLNYLKIDRSFIQFICSIEDKQAVVDAIIQMAHRLNMRVIAEGVEQKEQVELLQTMGCDMIQGYYYSKPLPLEGIIHFIEMWQFEMEGNKI